MKQLKVDITNRVTGIFKDGYLELRTKDFPIGKVTLEQSMATGSVELEDGYIYENGKIFMIVSIGKRVESK